MSKTEENKLNKIGDELAERLNIPLDSDNSPDSTGRKRWSLRDGNKTGLGLLRTLEGFFIEMKNKT